MNQFMGGNNNKVFKGAAVGLHYRGSRSDGTELINFVLTSPLLDLNLFVHSAEGATLKDLSSFSLNDGRKDAVGLRSSPRFT